MVEKLVAPVSCSVNNCWLLPYPAFFPLSAFGHLPESVYYYSVAIQVDTDTIVSLLEIVRVAKCHTTDGYLCLQSGRISGLIKPW
jgi:hypothetical protein